MNDEGHFNKEQFWKDHKARYTPDTKGGRGMGANWGFVIHEDATLSKLSMTLEERKELSKAVTFHWESRSFLDQPDFSTNDGVLSVVRIRPQIGGVGWARYPGFDHYIVSKRGKVAFKTKNYAFVLKYLIHWVSKYPQPERTKESEERIRSQTRCAA